MEHDFSEWLIPRCETLAIQKNKIKENIKNPLTIIHMHQTNKYDQNERKQFSSRENTLNSHCPSDTQTIDDCQQA